MEKLCDVCGEKPAVVKLIAVNANDEVLDTYYVCLNDKNGWEPATGKQVKPFIK